jgi:hypothetical protein
VSDAKKWLLAQAGEMPPSLRVGEVARAALRAGRRRFARVVGATVIVFGGLGLAQAFVDHILDPVTSWPAALAQVALGAVNILGVMFLAGYFGRAIGATEHGLPDRNTWYVLRTQPYGRLIGADLLVSLCSGVGFVLLILPGFVIFTHLALAGAAIRFEGRTGIEALRRSAQVVRHHFWTVAALATLPLIVAGAILFGVDALSRQPFVVYFVVRLMAQGSIAAVSGLMLSELGYRLFATQYAQESRSGV